MRKSAVFVIALIAFLSLASVALAAEGAPAAAASWLTLALPIGAGLAIGVAAGGSGIGMGSAVRGALEGLARNPGVSGKIMTFMIVGLAFIESLAIYGLVVAFILIGKIPS